MTVIKIAAINQKEGSPNKESPLILFCEMLEFSFYFFFFFLLLLFRLSCKLEE